ncbi:MAG: VRR-NUC domain-containing protein [Proteobacteria bacterium]|nr:VRR-NUC domain-containing protein [Pseudomonadota bacterium]
MGKKKEVKNIADQCAKLKVELRQLALPRLEKKWVVAEKEFSKPETAALEFFLQRGYIGTCCEGGPLLLLLKSMIFRFLVKINIFQDRTDAIQRFLEAQLTIHKNKKKQFISSIIQANRNETIDNFREIYANSFVKDYYKGVSEDVVMGLYDSLGIKLLSEILSRFMTDPYSYRAGWPDLTIVKDNQITLIEVKTTDAFHDSQLRIIKDFIQPHSLPFFVLQIVKAPGPVANYAFQ